MFNQQNFKRILLIGFLLICVMMLLTSCTGNQRARQLGGTETVTLEPNQRVVNITWKETNLWILTKQDTTKPITYEFKEHSGFGLIQGKVIIVEQ